MVARSPTGDAVSRLALALPEPAEPREVAADGGPIVFFDGVCALCDGFVRFVVARDAARRFRFAPLQGTTFQELAVAAPRDLSTIVLADGSGLHDRSAAVLRVLVSLPAPWGILGRLLLWVPRPLADAAYRFVAAHRYRWFGRHEYCAIPSPGDRLRFLP
jgi:predicted DCC family thiol-disulfide oxidoreductase YuxK